MNITADTITQTDVTANITFSNRDQANQFASAWARKTFMGHSIGNNKDGSVSVKIYNITEELKNWIDSYIQDMNNSLNSNDIDLLEELMA